MSPGSDPGPVARCLERIGTCHHAAFLAILVLVQVTITTALITGAHLLPFDRLATSDVPLFDERAGLILKGDWLAEGASVRPDTPPLVNYLFLVPHLLGGSLAVYAAWFSLWVLAGALVLHHALADRDPLVARGVALFLVTHPAAWGTALLIIQDEAMVAAFVAFAFAALLRGSWGHAGVWTGLGTLVKAIPAIGAPALLFSAPDGRRRRHLVLGGGLAVALPLLPFFFLDPGTILYTLGFYAGGVRPDRTTPSGISMWKFLDETTGTVIEPLLVALLILTSLVVWALVARRRLDPTRGYALTFLLFFLLYPKIHFGYYLILVVVLAPWLIRRPGAAFLSLVLAGTAAATHMVWYGFLPWPGAKQPLVPLLLAGVSWTMVVFLGLSIVAQGPAVPGSVPSTGPVPGATTPRHPGPIHHLPGSFPGPRRSLGHPWAVPLLGASAAALTPVTVALWHLLV